jgi:hypothetical protein
MPTLISWVSLHPWIGWPLLINNVFGLLWFIWEMFLLAYDITRLGHNRIEIVGPSVYHYFLMVFGGLIYLIILLLTPFGVFFLLAAYERQWAFETSQQIKGVITKYRLKYKLASPKFTGGNRRLMITCPQCGSQYSYFGYGKCQECQHEIPFSHEEVGLLAELRYPSTKYLTI